MTSKDTKTSLNNNSVSAKTKSNNDIAVLIPSYNRPKILEITLQRWLEANFVDKIFLVAEASSKDILDKYEEIITKYSNKGNKQIIYKLTPKRSGSVKARNTLLEIASKHNCKYVVMADDDYILPNEDSLLLMAKKLDLNDRIGAVGGKVIVKGRRKDPDFFLNLPWNLADLASKLFGYVFLDIKHGPRISEFLPHFFMLRTEILDSGIRYDEVFDTPTGFREESDFQQQIKHIGYSLLYEPKAYIIHLAVEKGGDRPENVKMKERIYWKARNNTIFIFKWNKSILKRVWYTFSSTLILLLYRPWHILQIFRGVKDGIKTLQLFNLI
jgi:GT2 family glycosyltransferase